MIDVSSFFIDWQWREPKILWLILVPFIWWIINFFIKRIQINNYADSRLLPWVKVVKVSSANFGQKSSVIFGKLLSPLLMLALAWICVVIALAGPRSLEPTTKKYSRAGVDILVALDLSSSMNAQDLKPNRFLFAKSLIESLVNRLEPNDRLALLAYAGHPHLVMPLSFDREMFQHYLSLINPDILPTKGSQLKPAIEYGVKHLQQTAGKTKILLVFTNGEPINFVRQNEPLNFNEISSTKTKVILIGVGKSAKAKIPDANDSSGYLYASGLLVNSRLEEIALQKLATRLSGEYIRASSSQEFMQELIDTIAIKAGKRDFHSSIITWQDHAIAFIWAAFFALLLAFYPIKLSSRMLPVFIFGFILPFIPQKSIAEPTKIEMELQAYESFLSQDYDLSQQVYDSLENFNGWFGAGSAAYKAEDYESAVQYFRQAAIAGLTNKNRSDALYNLGNTYYRANLLAQAIESYQQALKYQATNPKTLHNLALAKQRSKLENKGQQQKNEQGDGKGGGARSYDDEGAFYGGQKPNKNEAGEGFSGDAPEGKKQGKDFILPNVTEDVDFTLKLQNQAPKVTLTDTANAILAQQLRIKRVEKFAQQMQQTEDKQQQLLIRIFEREEGFEAIQEKPHAIPGVKPW